jgi:hypothetical protein
LENKGTSTDAVGIRAKELEWVVFGLGSLGCKTSVWGQQDVVQKSMEGDEAIET